MFSPLISILIYASKFVGSKRMKYSDGSGDEVELDENPFIREEYSDRWAQLGKRLESSSKMVFYVRTSSSDDDIDNIKSSHREQLLDMLNNDDQNSLSTIPNMTQKKMDLIVSNRPYSSWQDLVRTPVHYLIDSLWNVTKISFFRYPNSIMSKVLIVLR